MTALAFLQNRSQMLNQTDRSEGPQELIPAAGYVAAAVVLFLIGFFGFTLNLSVIVFMWKQRQLWTPINAILFNLVLSDLMVSIFGNPWTFAAAVSRRWIFGHGVCVFYGFIMSLLGITSITTLTVLAFERYLMITKPLRGASLNFRVVGVLIAAIWGYSLCLTAPPLIGWGQYVNEGADISCSVNWEEKSFNSMTYILYLFIFGLFIPLSVIVFSYTSIIITTRRSGFRTGRVTKAERKVALMIFIMIVAFLTAWSPYAILALIIQFGDSTIVTPGIAVFPALLAKSSICYNPVIYIGLNVQIQSGQGLNSVDYCDEVCFALLLITSVIQFQQSWKQLYRRDGTVGSQELMTGKRHFKPSDEITDVTKI